MRGVGDIQRFKWGITTVYHIDLWAHAWHSVTPCSSQKRWNKGFISNYSSCWSSVCFFFFFYCKLDSTRAKTKRKKQQQQQQQQWGWRWWWGFAVEASSHSATTSSLFWEVAACSRAHLSASASTLAFCKLAVWMGLSSETAENRGRARTRVWDSAATTNWNPVEFRRVGVSHTVVWSEIRQHSAVLSPHTHTHINAHARTSTTEKYSRMSCGSKTKSRSSLLAQKFNLSVIFTFV